MDSSIEEAEVISLANSVLHHSGVTRTVTTLKQCNSKLFSQLYEALTGCKITGVVSQAPTSEVVKCQHVVDALSQHLSPHISLEHITGTELALLDCLAIKNLLDIFSVLFHMPVEAPIDGEKVSNSEANDSNFISTEGLSVISEVIREELGPSSDSTDELLRPVSPANLPHSVRDLLQPHTITSSSGHTRMGQENAAILHTPPQSPSRPSRLMSSPLHHSTPHASTRSRVFNVVNSSNTQDSIVLEEPLLPHMHAPTSTSSSVPTLLCSKAEESSVMPRSSMSSQLAELSIASTADRHPMSNSSRQEDSTQIARKLTPTKVDERPNSSRSYVEDNTLITSRIPSKVHFSASTNQGDDLSSSCSDEAEVNDIARQSATTRANVLATLYQKYRTQLRKQSKPTNKKYKRKGKRSHPTLPPLKQTPSPRRYSSSSSGNREKDESSLSSDSLHPPDTPTKIAVGDDMLPLAKKEFPFIHVSPSTMHRLWQRQLKQITTLTQTCHSQDTSVCKKIAEMEYKQKALLQVIKKELEHTKRMQRQIEQKQVKQAVQSKLHHKRQATARARRYFNDYELRLKTKMQKRRIKEEQIFKKAFEDGLELQRERIREVKRYAKEKQQAYAKQQQDQLESIENYYRDQFALLAESLARERDEVSVRDKAQHQLVQRMKNEMRKKMEREIQQLQACLDREEDIAHFRQLDAHKYKQKLSHITFTSSEK